MASFAVTKVRVVAALSTPRHAEALNAVTTSITGFLPSGRPHAAAAIVSAILLASGAVMSFWLRKENLERRWYNSRAVAESVKTL